MSNYYYDNIKPNYKSGNKNISIDPLNNNILITDGVTTQNIDHSGNYIDATGGLSAKYTATECKIQNSSNYSSITPALITIYDTTTLPTTTQIDIYADQIVLGNPSPQNFLTTDNWSGKITTQNTVANSTHYLGFFNSSSTSNERPQKNINLSCNPSNGIISATTVNATTMNATNFIGSASTVDLGLDNTAGTYFIPFSKTATASNNILYVDNTIGPLTYNPSVSSLAASVFVGEPQFSSTANSVTYTASTLSFSGGTFSIRNFNFVLTGTVNTIGALTLTNIRTNAVYCVGILNNGTGNATFNTGLGTNIFTKYSSAVVIPAGGFAVMRIYILGINSVQRTIVDVYNVFV